MKLSLVKAAAAVTLAAAATFAVPTMAAAYAPPPAGAPAGPIAPGSAVPFTGPAGTFLPGEPILISVTGENASGVALGAVKFVVETATLAGEADADGGMALGLVFPENASGPYSISFTSASNPIGITANVAVDPALAGGGSGTGGTGSLPVTGADASDLLGLWVGGGALVLAGGAVAVGATIHRQRRQAA